MGTEIERHRESAGFLNFDEAKRRAVVLADSGLVPESLRKKPEAVMLVGLYGQDLGVPFVVALNEIHVIKGRVSASAQLRLALIRRAGHEARFKVSTAERAVIRGRRLEDKDDPDGWVEVEWTIAQAEAAGLTAKEVWKAYPAEMLRARAASALCRMHFSDVLLGLDPYSPEELGVDEAAEVDPGPGDDEPVGAPSEPDEIVIDLDAQEPPQGEEAPGEQVPDEGHAPHDTKSPDGTGSSSSDEGPNQEPARPLAQQIAMQAQKAGVARGDVILAVTKGRTSSGRAVTEDEGRAVLQAIEAIVHGDVVLVADGDERHLKSKTMTEAQNKARPAPEPGEPAKAKPVAPPEPGPAPKTKEPAPADPPGEEDTWDADAWRAFLAARGIKVTQLLREALKIAKELKSEPPASLDALKGQQTLCAELRGFVEEQAESRAS